MIRQINSEEYLNIIADPALHGAYDPKQMLRMVEAARACVSESPSLRPQMGQVRELSICILWLQVIGNSLKSHKGNNAIETKKKFVNSTKQILLSGEGSKKTQILYFICVLVSCLGGDNIGISNPVVKSQ